MSDKINIEMNKYKISRTELNAVYQHLNEEGYHPNSDTMERIRQIGFALDFFNETINDLQEKNKILKSAYTDQLLTIEGLAHERDLYSDQAKQLQIENENLSKGYDDWHNLYCKIKEQNTALINALIEVQAYQMNYVELARTTKLYNIAETALEPIQKECDHKIALDIGYPKCLMCGKELPYVPSR